MSRFRLAWRCANVLLLGLMLSGCGADGPLDEEKEPHFLAGRNRVMALDSEGAIDCFEKALEVNPRSASAHFELACIYEKLGDDAAAIYHYERFLRFRPNSEKADLAKGRIMSCKTELAKSVSVFGQPTAAAQRDYEKLMVENRDLRTQLAQWQAFYTSIRPAAAAASPKLVTPPPPPLTNADPGAVAVHEPAPAAAPPVATRVDAPASIPPASMPANASLSSRTATTPVSARTYKVKTGDLPSSIARHYGISVTALLAANPQVRPTRLQPGQVLNIPASN